MRIRRAPVATATSAKPRQEAQSRGKPTRWAGACTTQDTLTKIQGNSLVLTLSNLENHIQAAITQSFRSRQLVTSPTPAKPASASGCVSLAPTQGGTTEPLRSCRGKAHSQPLHR